MKGLKVAVFLAGMGIAGYAQAAETAVVKNIDAVSGRVVQLGVMGAVTPDCENDEMKISITQKPSHGKLSSKKGKLKVGKITRCPDLAANAAIIFYKPDFGFTGADSVVVKTQTKNGTNKVFKYQITVR
jgi:hypothetical protein